LLYEDKKKEKKEKHEGKIKEEDWAQCSVV
jgi:hypothetical protein